MSDDNFLAFQYALGLLDSKQKQAIKSTEMFDKSLAQWRLKLSKINTMAPLQKQSAKKLWQNINMQIQIDINANKTSFVDVLIGYWRYMLSGFAGLSLLLSIALLNQTVNAELGWNINTNLLKQQVSVIVTTHKHTNKSSVCTLWVKNHGKVLLIGAMPETGVKTFSLNTQMSTMIKGGEMIISFENKKAPVSAPTIIDYQGKWLI